jgi:hypothetical protein
MPQRRRQVRRQVEEILVVEREGEENEEIEEVNEQVVEERIEAAEEVNIMEDLVRAIAELFMEIPQTTPGSGYTSMRE